jgi:hypothetical protein
VPDHRPPSTWTRCGDSVSEPRARRWARWQTFTPRVTLPWLYGSTAPARTPAQWWSTSTGEDSCQATSTPTTGYAAGSRDAPTWSWSRSTTAGHLNIPVQPPYRRRCRRGPVGRKPARTARTAHRLAGARRRQLGRRHRRARRRDSGSPPDRPGHSHPGLPQRRPDPGLPQYPGQGARMGTRGVGLGLVRRTVGPEP